MPKKKLSGKCKKCGNPSECIWVYCADYYLFCRGCDAILSAHGTGDSIQKFLDGTLELNKVDSAMIQARQRRNNGRSPWRDKKE